MNPEDIYHLDESREQSEDDRQWFFEVNGRFPENVDELDNFLDMKLEDISINQAEELAATDLMEE